MSFPVGKGTTFSLEPVDTITGNSYSTDKVVQGIDVIDFEDRFAIGNGAVTSGNISNRQARPPNRLARPRFSFRALDPQRMNRSRRCSISQ